MARLAATLVGLALLGPAWGCSRSAEPAPEAAEDLAPEPVPRAEEPRPPSAARVRQAKACEEGDPQACFVLAEMLDRGEGGPADPAQARALYEQACAAGSFEACDVLGH